MKRILLIESDRKRAEVLTDWLAEMGPFQPDVLGRIEDAADWVSLYDTRLVILSSEISESRGTLLESLEQLKRARPTAGIVVLSAQPTVEEAVASMRIGADDYLSSSCTPEEFKTAARRAIEKSAVFSGSNEAGGLLDLMVTCQLISASGNEFHVVDLIRGYMSRITGSQWVGIFVSRDGAVPTILKKEENFSEVLEVAVAATSAFSGWDQPAEDYRLLSRGALAPSLLVVRLPWLDGKFYYWVALSPRADFSLSDLESRLRLLKSQVESTARSFERFEGVHRLAYLDEVTGLFNIRFLSHLLDQEIQKSQKSGAPFAVFFVDIDFFKNVNDQHGHLVGSRVLQLLGQHLKKWIPESKHVFRYGGDEFVALVPRVDLKTALEIAERVRAQAEAQPFEIHPTRSLALTLSIGVALYPDHARTKESLMAAADEAMYEVKRSTRNAVFMARVPQ